ncbi:MAG: OmpA family protein [Bdellovibrionales bacterium]|nr:OmpA family protein [Bdellovibrionales bacterium]
MSSEPKDEQKDPAEEPKPSASIEAAYESFRSRKAATGRQSEEQSVEAFGVSFTSFSMIMLAFFVYLNSLAVPDVVRKRTVIGSLSEHFVRADAATPIDGPPSGQQIDIPIPELIQGFPELTFSTKHSMVADAAEDASFDVVRETDRFIITLPGEELFASGDDRLKAEVLPALKRIGELVKQRKLYAEVEGHTDNQPISTRRFPSNWALSIARAVSVLRLFIDIGVTPGHISASGRGEFVPVASNDTLDGRAENRRVVLVISEKDPLGGDNA